MKFFDLKTTESIAEKWQKKINKLDEEYRQKNNEDKTPHMIQLEEQLYSQERLELLDKKWKETNKAASQESYPSSCNML